MISIVKLTNDEMVYLLPPNTDVITLNITIHADKTSDTS
jgi:hypothetical protein